MTPGEGTHARSRHLGLPDVAAMAAPAAMAPARIRSTSALTSDEGAGVSALTPKATAKFKTAPNVPMPSGEIPKSQFSGILAAKGSTKTPLK